MTDNEIIKALKRIAQYSGFTDDVSNTLLSALDLINRQKAEIERLNIESETLVTQLKVAYEQIHKLNMAKSEARKKFAERLKETITNAINTYYNSNGGGYYLAEDVIEDIDNLVKEMTEVQE